MHVACFAASLFLFAFVVHWLWWRVRIPQRQSAALLLIFMAALPLGLAAAWMAPPVRTLFPWDFWSLAQVVVFHTSLTLAYIVTYSGLEERSPSMTLLVHVAEARGGGRTREELYAVLSGATPIETRLAAMVRDNMVERADERYRITAKGRVWATAFGTWRRLVGLQKGG